MDLIIWNKQKSKKIFQIFTKKNDSIEIDRNLGPKKTKKDKKTNQLIGKITINLETDLNRDLSYNVNFLTPKFDFLSLKNDNQTITKVIDFGSNSSVLVMKMLKKFVNEDSLSKNKSSLLPQNSSNNISQQLNDNLNHNINLEKKKKQDEFIENTNLQNNTLNLFKNKKKLKFLNKSFDKLYMKNTSKCLKIIHAINL